MNVGRGYVINIGRGYVINDKGRHRAARAAKKGLKKLCRVPGNLLATRTFHVASLEASSLNRLHTCKQKSQLEAIG